MPLLWTLVVWSPYCFEAPKTTHKDLSRTEWDNHCPPAATSAVLDACQGTSGAFGCQTVDSSSTCHLHNPPGLFLQVAFQFPVLQFVQRTRVIPSQARNLALALVKFHMVCNCPTCICSTLNHNRTCRKHKKANTLELVQETLQIREHRYYIPSNCFLSSPALAFNPGFTLPALVTYNRRLLLLSSHSDNYFLECPMQAKTRGAI